jgi:hypothetical protein
MHQGRAENRAHAESKKDRTPNKMATSPGEECAKERQGGDEEQGREFCWRPFPAPD